LRSYYKHLAPLERKRVPACTCKLNSPYKVQRNKVKDKAQSTSSKLKVQSFKLNIFLTFICRAPTLTRCAPADLGCFTISRIIDSALKRARVPTVRQGYFDSISQT